MPFNIWFKYGESQPAKVKFDGEDVDDLKEAIKKKLKPRLDDVATADIILRRCDEEADLEPDSPSPCDTVHICIPITCIDIID